MEKSPCAEILTAARVSLPLKGWQYQQGQVRVRDFSVWHGGGGGDPSVWTRTTPPPPTDCWLKGPWGWGLGGLVGGDSRRGDGDSDFGSDLKAHRTPGVEHDGVPDNSADPGQRGGGGGGKEREGRLGGGVQESTSWDLLGPPPGGCMGCIPHFVLLLLNTK